MIIIIICVIWYLIGVWSFIFWWTKEFDFTTGDIFICLFSAVVGPINFLIGWGVFAEHSDNPSILIRRAKK